MLQVFSANEEVELERYLKRTSDIYFGLSPNAVRKLAYEYAVFLKKVIPAKWSDRLIAGKDWFTGFLKRHPSLSVCCSQTTTVARAISFNQHNVNFFFENLSKVMDRYKFSPGYFWNMGNNFHISKMPRQFIVFNQLIIFR